MAGPIPTSFVPQKPIQRDARSRAGGDVFMGASVVLLISSLALAGATFAWKWYLTKERDAKTEEVLALRKEVDQEAVRQLSRLSERIRIGRELLEARVAPSLFLTHLESRTVSGVRFKELKFSNDPTGISVYLTGEAQDFNALAYEAQVLGDAPLIKDQIFSDISVDETGKVTFELSGMIDAGNILAKSQFASVPQNQPPVYEQSTPLNDATTSPQSSTTTPQGASTTPQATP